MNRFSLNWVPLYRVPLHSFDTSSCKGYNTYLSYIYLSIYIFEIVILLRNSINKNNNISSSSSRPGLAEQLLQTQPFGQVTILACSELPTMTCMAQARLTVSAKQIRPTSRRRRISLQFCDVFLQHWAEMRGRHERRAALRRREFH